MKTLGLVDLQNIWYGMQRVTGLAARIDFVKLRKAISTSEEDLMIAYVITPVQGETKQPLRDDRKFAAFLKKAGFSVHRQYAQINMDDSGVHFDKSHTADRMFFDVVKFLPSFDRLVVVSGSGAMIPLVNKAKSDGKPVVIASFDKAGDLNRELGALADSLIHLDASYKFERATR